MPRPKALYILGNGNRDLIYGQREQNKIAELVEEIGPTQTRESILDHPDLMADLEIILSGWGGPWVDADFLDKAPNLKAIFYGSGSIRSVVSDEFWKRGLTICSAWGANAVPVAEYTLSQILWCLKLGYTYARRCKNKIRKKDLPVFGGFRSTVGLVSLGMIGRLVAKLLQHFEVNVLVYDPFVEDDAIQELGATRADDIDHVFRESAVVSLHTPNLPSTQKMIKGRHFELMQQNAAFINTARGAVVDELAMIDVLQKRPDITAVLDVTYPEPPADDSPLFTLDNVVLTPHIAGSMHEECQRMGLYMTEELERYLNGNPLRWQVTPQIFARMA